MALPGHSPPPPFVGSGSPPRIMNDNQLPSMYGPPTRPMLPPSPHYRFPHAPPIPTPSPSLPAINDSRSIPPYKRPGSSMSISSMLGGEPEKSGQDVYQNHNSRAPSRQGSMSAPAPNAPSTMSPPQQSLKLGMGEYSYKPRSQTPENHNAPFSGVGSRQRSSSSGTPLQRPGAFNEPFGRASTTTPTARFGTHPNNVNFGAPPVSLNGHEERARRTSLSEILQRPNSQPQAGQNVLMLQDGSRPNMVQPLFQEQLTPSELTANDTFRPNGMGGSYDTKPPGSHNAVRPNTFIQASPTRTHSQPDHPESRRPSDNGVQGNTLASILNGPTSQPSEGSNAAAQRMLRQDSAQSQGDRSGFGDHGKHRQFSPFASSFNPQNQSISNLPSDSQVRKGSDELSQHHAILRLSADSKRGRYSPKPQVMQGAQAQTPVPDTGVKTEHGKVFVGLGGGIGSAPTPTPIGGPKRDDGRSPFNEDSLRMSRTNSGFNKRSRKLQDEENSGDQDLLNGSRGPGGRHTKKGKHQHSYKLDLEETASPAFGRRTTPITSLNISRNMPANPSTPLIGGHNSYLAAGQRAMESIPSYKPKTTIRVGSVYNIASKSQRRHLGSFTYKPTIAQSDLRKPNPQKFDVSITPNLMPCFSAAEHVNCTYTVHVPKMWLQERERGLICTEQYLWGSGIYTDDSDPVAAAIHAGFLKASFGESVDTGLLSRVVADQNPKIEWPKDLKLPDQPMQVEQGKDLNITLVVLPLLERYEGSARFGIRSKTWSGGLEQIRHDGVSFGVLKIEFVNVGMQEMRIGRSGASRRQRLRMDLESRQKSLQSQKEKVAKARAKQLEQLRPKRSTNARHAARTAPTSAPLSTSNGTVNASIHQAISVAA